MSSSAKPKSCGSSVDDALLAPWVATGVVDAQDARLFGAALAADPALEDELAAAHAEHAAVAALGEALGRPSMRPLLALFAAIDAEATEFAPNVVRFASPSSPRTAFGLPVVSDLKLRKIRLQR